MRHVVIAMVLSLPMAAGLAPCLAPQSAQAEEVNPIEARLVDGLQAQGYTIVERGYTWLGRLRVVAENAVMHRELVINPGTGEVLRDYAVLISDLPGRQVADSTVHHNKIAPSLDGEVLSSSALSGGYQYGTADRGLLSGAFLGGSGTISVIAPGEKGVPTVLLSAPAMQE